MREAVTGFRHTLNLMIPNRDLIGTASVLQHLTLMAEKAGKTPVAFKTMAVASALQRAAGDPDARESMKIALALASKAGIGADQFQGAVAEAAKAFMSDEGKSLIHEVTETLTGEASA